MLSPFINIYKYARLFEGYLGKKIYLVLVFSVLVSLLEGFGILMLLPLLENLDNLATAEDLDPVSMIIYDFIELLGFTGSIVSILILISVIFFLKGVFAFIAHAYNGYLMGNLLKNLKSKLYDAYSKMNYQYYSSKNSGHFTSLINEQPSRAINALQQLSIFGGQLINVIFLMVLAIFIAFEFGLMAITIGLCILILFKSLNNYVRNLSRLTAKENSNLNNWIIQALQSHKYLSATSQVVPLRKKAIESIRKLTGFQVKTTIAAGFTQSIREPLAVIFIMSIIFIQIYFFEGKVETILVAIILFYRALTAALQVQSFFQGTYQYIGSMELIDEEFNNLATHKERDGQTDIHNFKDQIEFKDVSFAYNESDYQITNLSLKIPALKSIAIVGASGSGKSTLLNMLTLLLRPNKGSIEIDGECSNHINKENWRNQLGYVSQETVIFGDTIANNICMWSGDYNQDPAVYEKIKNAAKQANIYEFIESLPDGFDSRVGDRGILLSGGQRQRLFIARELFRNPKLLILDEATSALDSSSEKKIQQSIDALKGKITVIQVAHRLSTIKNADLIYVIDNGSLIEFGTFFELINNKKSYFSKLVNQQEI